MSDHTKPELQPLRQFTYDLSTKELTEMPTPRKRLFNEYEAHTVEADQLDRAFVDAITPILNKYEHGGFSLIDIEAVATQAISVLMAEHRLVAGVAAARADRNRAAETAANRARLLPSQNIILLRALDQESLCPRCKPGEHSLCDGVIGCPCCEATLLDLRRRAADAAVAANAATATHQNRPTEEKKGGS